QTAIALGVLSTQQTFQLLAPLGLPTQSGCALLVQPTVVLPVVASAGRASIAVPMPNTPAITGIFLQHQVLSFGLDAGGALTSVGATQGLSMIVGSLW